MDTERQDAQRAFFDGLADRWDRWEDLERLDARLSAGLDAFGVGPDETVLDIGCGTGNLARALVRRLSSEGRVVAVDPSPAMIARARDKVADGRVAWHVATADRLPLPAASADRAILFSVWPHLDPREAVVAELARVLRPGGSVHVWHLASRERINAIHAAAGEAVRDHLLPPAADTARLFEAASFRVTRVEDGEEAYLVTAEAPRGGTT